MQFIRKFVDKKAQAEFYSGIILDYSKMRSELKHKQLIAKNSMKQKKL